MTLTAHVLIADDEVTFLESTADLLRKEGYECTAVPDAVAAVKLLQKTRYALLIADIRMAGNLQLELIKELAKIADGMPVILVTGYPSVQTAIAAIQLPVVAYLVKPFEFEDLRREVRNGIERCRLYSAVCDAQRRADSAGQSLRNVAESLRTMSKTVLSAPLTSFLTLTLGNILDGLFDLERLTGSLLASRDPQAVVQVAKDFRLKLQRNLLEETIETLEKTKSAFKSKELGQLRKRLQESLKEG